MHSSGLLTKVADPLEVSLRLKSFLLMEAVDFLKESRLWVKVEDLRLLLSLLEKKAERASEESISNCEDLRL